jgi:hypothetical protein
VDHGVSSEGPAQSLLIANVGNRDLELAAKPVQLAASTNNRDWLVTSGP